MWLPDSNGLANILDKQRRPHVLTPIRPLDQPMTFWARLPTLCLRECHEGRIFLFGAGPKMPLRFALRAGLRIAFLANRLSVVDAVR